MITDELRASFIKKLNAGKITRIDFSDPFYYEYWNSLTDEYIKLLSKRGYKMLQAHKDYLKVFGFGKLTKFTNSLMKIQQMSTLNGKEKLIESIKTDHLYNKTFQKTEIEEIQDLAASAEEFDILKDDGKEYYIYTTMHDNRVRPEHVELDGIIRPKDDEIWRSIWVPNGYGCRCKINSISAEEAESLNVAITHKRKSDSITKRHSDSRKEKSMKKEREEKLKKFNEIIGDVENKAPIVDKDFQYNPALVPYLLPIGHPYMVEMYENNYSKTFREFLIKRNKSD